MGMDRYIELINLRYGIYDRGGNLLPNAGSEGDVGALTGLPVTELSDPQILWDPAAQRFYYGAVDVGRLQFAFGYSIVPNPTSAADFCHYTLDYGYGSTFSLPDYPKMAVTNDYVLFGANIFFFASVYNGSDLDWISKPTSSTCPASLVGGQFAKLRNVDGTYTSTPVPVQNADPSGTGWVVGSTDPTTATANTLSVFSVTAKSDGTPLLTGPTAVPVAQYGVPASAPQAGTSATLDTLDSRLTHAVGAVDPRLGATAIWTSHAVFGGAGSEQRWYEIRTDGTPRIAQSGVVTSPTDFVWNGAVAPNRANDGAGTAAFGSDMVLGFNTSSSTSYPALRMVSKRGAAGQSAWVLVQQSTGANQDPSCGPVCRWGDYAGAVPDPNPAAGGRVWLSGEWNLPSSGAASYVWRTWNWSATP
jgi:hypothetical protein